jgi:phosphoinositide-3-kinase regulatory subunit 4
LVSRPFLTCIEKYWITYQLLNAIQSLHDAGIPHGHITTENVLLTSWNWVLIADVGCQHLKPVTLPDDDPGMWIHWFEGRGGGNSGESEKDSRMEQHNIHHGEKKCCLAPERFYSPKSGDENALLSSKLTPQMDTFSLGCVLIELFLNGERALDLGDLMEYRRLPMESSGASLPVSLKQKLDKIESSKMRAACRHMLSLDPAARLSPSEVSWLWNVCKFEIALLEKTTDPRLMSACIVSW